MPNINRIRVNNVKYNFGTQFYDDFTMRMHGKNTLYDLANGGGKSVLMLLLLQNLIPNCTLDEKQPVEKLFRTGSANTTIHSLIEWRLDTDNTTEGYRYMTTGFCARKAKDAEEGELRDKDVAAIEYFNYCIFYREYNKNDIINLPLTKDGERITYQGLRAYLKELEHRDMGLMVRIFDRKGEYQRFISDYGLHESQWEIIRGINKTEGHVRTYFESNYKTTRKVVEDLLIEEIIEKAFLVKTNRDEAGEDSMARMLMDIKEQLALLARKKRDISTYDHQIELIGVLADKVASFMDLYEEQSSLSETIANICVTGAEFAKNDEAHIEELSKRRDSKREEKNTQRERIECLKVERDKFKLEEQKKEADELKSKLAAAEKHLGELVKDLNLKESVNDYLEYIEDRNKYRQYDAVVKTMMEDSSFDEELMYCYTYNIKMRTDVMLTEIKNQISIIKSSIEEAKAKNLYQQKLLTETRVSLAVAKSSKQSADDEIAKLSEKLSKIRMSMSEIKFMELTDQIEDSEREMKALEEQVDSCRQEMGEYSEELGERQLELSILQSKKEELAVRIQKLKKLQGEFEQAKNKLDNIKTVYNTPDITRLSDTIAGRITDAILDTARIKTEIEKGCKSIKRLEEGRVIPVSKGAAKVMDYIETRHGLNAIYGMDYLSAIPSEAKAKLLETNPELPFGVIVSDYDSIKDDPNISIIDTDDETINIYDMDRIGEKALYYGENAFPVHRNPGELGDEEFIAGLVETEKKKVEEMNQQLSIKQEMLTTYRQDQEFVLRLTDESFLGAARELELALSKEKETLSDIEAVKGKIKALKSGIEQSGEKLSRLSERYEAELGDINKLYTVRELSEIISDKEKLSEASRADIERFGEILNQSKSDENDSDRELVSLEARLKSLESSQARLMEEWDNTYKSYYDVDKEYEILTVSDEELKAKFTAMISMGSQDAKAIEDKRLLMDTLSNSMERTLRNIEKRRVAVSQLAEYEAKKLLYVSDEAVLETCRRNIDEIEYQKNEYMNRLENKRSEISHLEGSIEYAVENIKQAFGRYLEEEVSKSEIISSLKSGEELLLRLEREARECEEEYRMYSKQQGYMIDLYKDVKRIVLTNDISLENAVPLLEDKSRLRELFEQTLIRFDRSSKNLEKAKNELLKFKSNTSLALEEMEVYELAGTIREDVVIPDDFDKARELVESLKSIMDYIRLERDRIEQSLVDMETIKENFEEQCIQRCLDVRTELDKLPKLSRIISDGEAIQMVGLTVPYVKDEFLKQRMSDYIDKLVAETDDYKNEKDRIKFIRNSLALKKLFGVIVTDMNAIKLSLYKRERIKEQSRYLRYEEAVGSTGQSQGIYIQFLVSIINYISGMYQTGNEDERTKTIFIDNPFGAAKDVYIWEPIFALLKANNVQLIVPARGATPAITGRFDVNYILGQQMSGGRQLTVVCDYTSKADQEEVEYQDLQYEQASFDFI